MKIKNSKFLIPLFSFVIILGVSVMALSAQEMGWQKKFGDENAPKPGPEFKEQMEEIMQNADYEAWQELVGDRLGNNQITADNFAKFTQAWTLAHNGDIEGAKAIYDELGLKGPMGFGSMRGHGRGFMEPGERPRMQDVNGDGFCDNLDIQTKTQE